MFDVEESQEIRGSLAQIVCVVLPALLSVAIVWAFGPSKASVLIALPFGLFSAVTLGYSSLGAPFSFGRNAAVAILVSVLAGVYALTS